MSRKPTIERSEIGMPAGDVTLPGTLSIPPHAQVLVIFAHGSGSSRFSRRNQFVADRLNDAGLATLLFDLLTADENEIDERTRELRFQIPFLANRLTATVDWAGSYLPTERLKVGLFGASTGAAAALITASERPDSVVAVVSRGGRPDLAADALPLVKAPTLLIVGGLDSAVIDLNKQASESLRCKQAMEIVPGATHLFEEPGKLDDVARLAAKWFTDHLGE